MSFTNVYYKRTAGTPKACYVCSRPTATVLATAGTVDFLYTCDAHLSDPGFASPMGESGDGVAGSRKLGLSAEEIQKVKEEWEEKQKKKQEKEAKEKEKDKEKKDDKDSEKEKGKEKEKKDTSTPSSSTPSPSPLTPKHQRYTLHRDFFAMRLDIHRKRRQTAQAKEVAPRLPAAPHIAMPKMPGGP